MKDRARSKRAKSDKTGNIKKTPININDSGVVSKYSMSSKAASDKTYEEKD